MKTKLIAAALGALLFSLLGTAPALSQDFPSKPINLVVPYPAGGGADIIARMLADSMRPLLGQPVTVTNRPGGQGTIGTAEVIRMAPDGYNLVLSAVATLTVQPHRQDLPYNSPDDYDPIIKAANVPMVLAVVSKAPWKTAREALDFARANPGKMRVGTPGNGSVGHLIVASVNSKANVRLAHVPYASGAESIPSMLGGHIEAVVAHPSELQPHIQAGNVKVLAAFEDKRNPAYPDAPTFKELGYDVSMGVYYPILAPKGLPPDVKAKIFKAAKTVLESGSFGGQAKDRGYGIDVKDPEALRKELWADFRVNDVLLKQLGMSKK